MEVILECDADHLFLRVEGEQDSLAQVVDIPLFLIKVHLVLLHLLKGPLLQQAEGLLVVCMGLLLLFSSYGEGVEVQGGDADQKDKQEILENLCCSHSRQ